MKVKNKKLEWFALIHDFNHSDIRHYNIFSEAFKDELYKEYRAKKITTLAQLKDKVERYCKYHYWSKSECEIAMGGLHDKYPEEFHKIDIWFQLEPNLNHIVNYINNYLEIGLE